jgi:two-component system phosphate regulon sensor histidine kinase PhoR
MSDLPEAQDRSEFGPRAIRRAAFWGGLLASFPLLAMAAVRGALDAWLLGAAVFGLALAALAAADRDRSRSVMPRHREQGIPSSGAAEALLANIPDPVILVDRGAIVREANAAASTLFSSLTIEHPIAFAVRSPVVLDGIEAALDSGEAVRVEYAERVPAERSFDVLIEPIGAGEDDQPGRTGVVLVFRDLTSSRRLENMRADFVANASHELRTPLASLLGLIETMQGPARHDAAARDRFLEIMREQAHRMARLIEDLLSLSRIEMRAHVEPDRLVDLGQIVRQAVDSLSPLARDQGVSIDLAIEGAAHWVQGDRDELLRLAENLVENALKYGASGRRVDVGLGVAPGVGARTQVELSVRDYGPGIAAEHLPRLTERFYRVDVGQSRDRGGTGLGLAIVKHIVNRHRGRLTIDSEPGRGAVFRVTLPERAPPARPA